MKIASFNVNSLRARLPIVLQWLAEYQPNILCVQETKVQDVDFDVVPVVVGGLLATPLVHILCYL